MADWLRKKSLLLLVVLYSVTTSGMALDGIAHCYSTAAESAITYHTGEARDLPVPSLTQRTYTPLTYVVIVLPTGFIVSTVIYPAERSATYVRFEEALPSYSAELFSTLADRAPPTA